MRIWSALRRMQALEPEYLLPGHGVPVMGADRVDQALGDTAEAARHWQAMESVFGSVLSA